VDNYTISNKKVILVRADSANKKNLSIIKGINIMFDLMYSSNDSLVYVFRKQFTAKQDYKFLGSSGRNAGLPNLYICYTSGTNNVLKELTLQEKISTGYRNAEFVTPMQAIDDKVYAMLYNDTLSNERTNLVIDNTNSFKLIRKDYPQNKYYNYLSLEKRNQDLYAPQPILNPWTLYLRVGLPDYGRTTIHTAAHAPSGGFGWYRHYCTQIRGSYADSFIGYTHAFTPPTPGWYMMALYGKTNSWMYSWRHDSLLLRGKPIAKAMLLIDSITCQYQRVCLIDLSKPNASDSLFSQGAWIQDSTYRRLWLWGDGSTSRDSQVCHAYTQPGVYQPKLIVSVSGNHHPQYVEDCTLYPKNQSDTFYLPRVLVLSAPKALFSISPPVGCAPINVSIADKSTGTVLRYVYQTSTGDSSTDANPQFTINATGKQYIIQRLYSASSCISIDTQFLYLYPALSGQAGPVVNFISYTESGQVTMNWNRTYGARNYNIYRDGLKLESTDDTTFTDKTPSNQPADYTLTALDSCGAESLRSHNSPIYLTGINLENRYNQLNWSQYKLNGNIITPYTPSLIINNEKLGILTLSATKYNDADHYDESRLQNCYRAVGTDSTMSNLVCIKYIPVLFIPNSYTPDDNKLNDSWMVRGIGLVNATVNIYNRWGQQVFSSNDALHEAWHPNALPMGQYIYQLTVRTNQGDNIYKSGIIHLIK